MSDATPSLVAGRYRLDERIGSGPMGEVWRGYDTRADWTVAVKTLGAKAAGSATREVLRQHAQAVARVIHPNVAMVLDVGEHDGSPFLVTEFLTGPSLGEELAARGPLKVVEVCDLAGLAAAGLDAAHRAGLVHGKVEPDSFRLAGSGVLKVVGFGLPGQPGDPRYQAPERLAGGDGQARSDLYGLGAVCYELLTGSPPAREGAIAPPGTLRPGVPAELDRLLLAMLDPEPAARPASGEAVRRALAAIARPRAVVTPPPDAPPAFAPPPVRAGDTAIFDAAELAPEPGRENRRLFIQAGAALAAIVAVTVGMILFANREDTPAPVPQATAEVAPSPDPTPSPTPTPTPTSSPTFELETDPQPTELRGTEAMPDPKGTIGRMDPAGGWHTWVRQFDATISLQLAGNGMDPRVAGKAQDKLRKAARKFDEGKERAGVAEVSKVFRDLQRARERNQIAQNGPLAEWLDDWRI